LCHGDLTEGIIIDALLAEKPNKNYLIRLSNVW